MNAIKEVVGILSLLYEHGWDERNGGNLSYIVEENAAKEICDVTKLGVTYRFDADLSSLVGRYLIITGTGSYFKNVKLNPEANLGLLKVVDSHTLVLLWGFNQGGRPTSEIMTHLRCHMQRLLVDPNHRVVMHCHPTNVICMTHIVKLENNLFTKILWKMQTESIVVFPEGVAVLPWMVCGGDKIGIETAKLMGEYRSVIWAQHGIFCVGKSLDEVFGLIETIEKAAEIFVNIADKPILQSISNENLLELAKEFKINYRKGIID